MENIADLLTEVNRQLAMIRKQQQLLLQQKQNAKLQTQNDANQITAAFAKQRCQMEEDLRTAETFLRSSGREGISTVNSSPRRPDFDYMMRLNFQLDDQNPNDPARYELAQAAVGAMKYLEQQLTNLDNEKSDALKKAGNAMQMPGVQQQEMQIRKQYDDFFSSRELMRLAAATKKQSDSFFINPKEKYDLPIPQTTSEILKFCMVHRTLEVPAEYENKLRSVLGIYYDPKTKTVRQPFGFRTDRAVKILIEYHESMVVRVQSILAGILFNVLRHYVPLRQRVVYIDPLTYNVEQLGIMRHFSGPNGLICHPDSEEAAIRALDNLIMAGSGKQRENRILIIRGYPGNLSTKIRDKIRLICSNAVQYRVSVILTREESAKCYRDAQDEAALNGALKICTDNQFFYMIRDGKKERLSMFLAPQSVTRDMVIRFRNAYAPKVLGCEFPKRVNMVQLPNLVKGTKRITVPFGVDHQDQLVQLDLNDTNFAVYLMGAAGSGKSTLLHTIITGIIRNYHPDDVELWLADFKMSEFAQYIAPMPPHVKYILMDESAEFVYDFVELLTQEMLRRKQFFAANPQLKKIDNVPVSEYMPVIVVMIDEFSLMSQVVDQSTKGHKEMLANLLVEGRALGFKFIFSSQEYTKGIQGLSGAAKDQVQTRIAMKNTVDEIRQTLEIPGSSVTEQIRQWVDTLPPHAALYKYFSTQKQKTVLERAQVMYFPGNAQDAYAPQKNMIDTLRKTMRPVSMKDYSPSDTSVYVNKEPVVADGMTYQLFQPQVLQKNIAVHKQTNGSYGDEIYIQLGSPRRLIQNKLEVLVNESRENLLLVTGDELPGAMSVILSVMKAFVLQKEDIQIWTYRRNRLYQTYRNDFFSKCSVFDSPETIGSAISELKGKIKKRQEGHSLIVLIGMDRILDEFAYADMNAAGPSETASELGELTVSTEQEKQNYVLLKQLQQAMEEEFNRVEDECIDAGMSDAEIDEACEKVRQKYLKQINIQSVKAPEKRDPVPVRKLVNYTDDFYYCLNQGSKFGYHFLFCVENQPKMKMMRISPELFRHKMAFRLGTEDSGLIFGNRRAAQLSNHTFLYARETENYTLRPFLHKGLNLEN